MPRTTEFTCPHCKHSSTETMHVSCIERHIRCLHCDELVTAPADAHCVWCAYGDTPCYLVQNQASCNPVKLTVADD